MSKSDFTDWENGRNMFVLLVFLLSSSILLGNAVIWLIEDGSWGWWPAVIGIPSFWAALGFAAGRSDA